MASQKNRRATYKRADRPEQKDERKQLILSAATAELALISSAEDFTLDALAQRAGVAKGTVYLYFKNKSAILMALLGNAIKILITDLLVRLSKIPEPTSAPKVAGAIRDSLKNSATSQQLARLLRTLSDEDSEDAHREFHKAIKPHVDEIDALIVRKLRGLRPGEGDQIMVYAWALLLGLSEMAEKSKNVKHCADGPKRPITNVNESLGEALTLLIEGYLARARKAA